MHSKRSFIREHNMDQYPTWWKWNDMNHSYMHLNSTWVGKLKHTTYLPIWVVANMRLCATTLICQFIMNIGECETRFLQIEKME